MSRKSAASQTLGDAMYRARDAICALKPGKPTEYAVAVSTRCVPKTGEALEAAKAARKKREAAKKKAAAIIPPKKVIEAELRELEVEMARLPPISTMTPEGCIDVNDVLIAVENAIEYVISIKKRAAHASIVTRMYAMSKSKNPIAMAWRCKFAHMILKGAHKQSL
jgi:hypothetical protein